MGGHLAPWHDIEFNVHPLLCFVILSSSLYHFDPSNLPPTATGGGPWPAAGGGKVSKRKFEKQKSFNSKNNLNSSSSLESSIDGPVLGKSVDCGLQTVIPADNGPGAVTTIMTMTASPPTTIAEEVVNELGCYDAGGGGTGGGGLKLLSVKDNPDMDGACCFLVLSCPELVLNVFFFGRLQKIQASAKRSHKPQTSLAR